MKLIFKTFTVFLVLMAYSFADSPIAQHPDKPEVDATRAASLVSEHLAKDKSTKDLYVSKIELIEASMLPAPRGSKRHWAVTAQRPKFERNTLSIYYVDMAGSVSTTPPPK